MAERNRFNGGENAGRWTERAFRWHGASSGGSDGDEERRVSPLAQLYVSFLEEEGYRPHIDEDGDVVFKEEGRTYFIDVDDSDEEFFRIVFPNFWEIESSEELARVIFAANYATMKTKVAKVYVRSDGKDTIASAELFFGDREQFKPVFHRAMAAIRAAVHSFVQKVREADDDGV
ncbi:MAG: hypothetical protein D6725_05955 [Planctomycetota bacterium]|nr:MAG: hypothetical protein D6725_05955 [Planctomycetota bacterium]